MQCVDPVESLAWRAGVSHLTFWGGRLMSHVVCTCARVLLVLRPTHLREMCVSCECVAAVRRISDVRERRSRLPSVSGWTERMLLRQSDS